MVEWWVDTHHITFKKIIHSTQQEEKVMEIGNPRDDVLADAVTLGLLANIILATRIKLSGKPNAYGLRVPLDSRWNFNLLNSLVTSVHDREVVGFLRYGWPLNRELDVPLSLTLRNHKGATDYKEAVTSYIEKELSLGALVGPLARVPWDTRVAISPMTTRPKKRSSKRRVLTDLSYPAGASVNDGIPKDDYYGLTAKVRYPTVDQLCRRAVQLSCNRKPGSIKGFKIDLNRAFRQIPTCPRDWSLLGTTWNDLVYFDKVSVMGSRTGPLACQRVTNLIRHLMEDMGYGVKNFVDDFMGIELVEQVTEAFLALRRLLRDLGVDEAQDKAVPPSYIVEFLGILFNLLTLTMEIPKDKVEDLLEELESWSQRSLTTRKRMESLLGKLQFASTCIRPGRVFVFRIIEEIKNLKGEELAPISQEMKKDIRWWSRALQTRNEVCMMWLRDREVDDPGLCTDSCLQSIGAVMGDQCIRADIPEHLRRHPGWGISHFEFLAVIISLQVWSDQVKGCRLRVYCDNQAVVSVINTGRAKDAGMQKCLRWFCYLLTMMDSLVKMVYIDTIKNQKADILSRSGLSAKHKARCNDLIFKHGLKERTVNQDFWLLNEE